MNTRLNIAVVQPEAYKVMYTLEKYLQTTQLSNTEKDLIKIRASQINGCAFCINMHTKDARSHGETEQRIYLLNAWKETTLFTDEEKNILALTEEITHISHGGVSEAVYQKALELFDEIKTAQIIMMAVTINAWNRIAITTQLQPE